MEHSTNIGVPNTERHDTYPSVSGSYRSRELSFQPLIILQWNLLGANWQNYILSKKQVAIPSTSDKHMQTK